MNHLIARLREQVRSFIQPMSYPQTLVQTIDRCSQQDIALVLKMADAMDAMENGKAS